MKWHYDILQWDVIVQPYITCADKKERLYSYSFAYYEFKFQLSQIRYSVLCHLYLTLVVISI